ncbi:MAG TPA: methionine synthase [Bacillota bacterium]
MSKLIVAAAIGDCVHVAGVLSFLQLAEEQGFKTVFLGPAVPVGRFCEAVAGLDADFAAVSYRLGPIPAGRLLGRLQERVRADPDLARRRWLLGGTPTVAALARDSGFFEAVFSGREDLDVVIAYLKAAATGGRPGFPPGAGSRLKGASQAGLGLLDRIAGKSPYPLLRHHFGRPTMAETIDGVRKIAEAEVLDVVSLGPDQNAQASFFRPGEQDPAQDGAGGVPIRSAADLLAIRDAADAGNHPLLRCYSGTRDLLRMARLLASTIGNAWAAVPLFWYNVLDGRSPRGLREAIAENQAAIRWHAEAGIPVEVNEAHHWSLRDAPDTIAVAAAYLAAYNARALGAHDYIAQLMLNTPPRTSARMDLAKMLAKMDLIETLVGPDFRVYRQVRAGLSSFPPDLAMARGQLAHATSLGMALKPNIVHVVGYSEADHIATADDVIESCKIARGVIRSTLDGLPDPAADPVVASRRRELRVEALRLIGAIADLAPTGAGDPLTDPGVLVTAVTLGYLDAPQLKGNPAAAGRVITRMIDGACVAMQTESGMPLGEGPRLAGLTGLAAKEVRRDGYLADLRPAPAAPER